MGATIRFSLGNLLASATLKNGTGGGAPARNETAPWVMENAQNQDRTLLWQGTSCNYDLDLGTDTPLRLFATLGMRSSPPGGVGISTVQVYACNAAAGYPGGLTLIGTYNPVPGQRDGYLLIGSNTSYRYVRFNITATGTFTLGRVYAGLLDVDLGMKYSAGATRTLIRPVQRNVPGTGSPLLTRIGDDYFQFNFPYDQITETTLGLLNQVATSNDILQIYRDDTITQNVLLNDQWSATHLYDMANLHKSSLEMMSLG